MKHVGQMTLLRYLWWYGIRLIKTEGSKKGSSQFNGSRTRPMIYYTIYVAGELRLAQYEKPLTKGHCPKKYKKPADEKEAEVKSEALAKRRTEKRERSHVLKEKITKLIESGLQLSEYQVCSMLTLCCNFNLFCYSSCKARGIRIKSVQNFVVP